MIGIEWTDVLVGKIGVILEQRRQQERVLEEIHQREMSERHEEEKQPAEKEIQREEIEFIKCKKPPIEVPREWAKCTLCGSIKNVLQFDNPVGLGALKTGICKDCARKQSR